MRALNLPGSKTTTYIYLDKHTLFCDLMPNQTRETYEQLFSVVQEGGKCVQAYGAPSGQGATYEGSSKIARMLNGTLPTPQELINFLIRNREEQETVRGEWCYLGNAIIDGDVDKDKVYMLRKERLVPVGPSSDPEYAVYVCGLQSRPLSFTIRASLETGSRFCIDSCDPLQEATVVFVIKDARNMFYKERKEFMRAIDELR